MSNIILFSQGKCVVDHTEKGWFITYIDRDPETIARAEAIAKKAKMDKDDEERMLDFVQKQAEKAKLEAGGSDEPPPEPMEFKRENEEEKSIALSCQPSLFHELFFLFPVQIALKPMKVMDKSTADSMVKSNPFEKLKLGESSKMKTSDKPTSSRLAALDEIRQFEERRKELENRKDYWLHPVCFLAGFICIRA